MKILNPTAKTALRRFAWIALAYYAASSIGLWAASLVMPTQIGRVTAYTVEISLIGAVTFGALYSMASILRSSPRTAPSSPP